MRSTPEFGMAKTGGNYASALRHVVRAKAEHQAVQVLFCPGGDVQETGASNFLLLNDDEMLTKPLDKSFLHGVTRDSILRLAERLGYRVVERDYSVTELFEWIEHGEAALSGTAAVLTGVGSVVYKGKTHTVGDGVVGPNTRRLCDALTDIQQGTAPDEFGWLSELGAFFEHCGLAKRMVILRKVQQTHKWAVVEEHRRRRRRKPSTEVSAVGSVPIADVPTPDADDQAAPEQRKRTDSASSVRTCPLPIVYDIRGSYSQTGGKACVCLYADSLASGPGSRTISGLEWQDKNREG